MSRNIKPLKGHPYHDKSDAELQYIVQDARAAAEAMRGWNDQAEAKYLDQMNDAITIMGYRVACEYRRRHGAARPSLAFQ